LTISRRDPLPSRIGSLTGTDESTRTFPKTFGHPATGLKDPAGPTNGMYKVFRGGSWNHAIEFARSRNRFMMSPSNGIYFVGFRLALGQTQQ